MLQVLSCEMCCQVSVIRPTSSGIVNKRKENAAGSLRLANLPLRYSEMLEQFWAESDLVWLRF